MFLKRVKQKEKLESTWYLLIWRLHFECFQQQMNDAQEEKAIAWFSHLCMLYHVLVCSS